MGLDFSREPGSCPGPGCRAGRGVRNAVQSAAGSVSLQGWIQVGQPTVRFSELEDFVASVWAGAHQGPGSHSQIGRASGPAGHVPPTKKWPACLGVCFLLQVTLQAELALSMHDLVVIHHLHSLCATETLRNLALPSLHSEKPRDI